MLAIGLTFVQTVFMTRVFGSELFGLLSFGLSISALLILLLSFGLDQVLMIEVASAGEKLPPVSQRWQQIWVLIRKFVVTTTAGIAVLGLTLIIGTDFSGIYEVVLLGTFILLPVIMARKYIESIALGAKQTLRSISGSQVGYPALMICGGFAVLALGIPRSTESITLVYVCAGGGSLVISIILIWPTLLRLRGNSVEVVVGLATETKGILKSGRALALISLGFVLSQHIDVLLTGFFATPKDAALVRIASRVAELSLLIQAVVILQYKPLLVEAFSKSDNIELQKHASNMVKLFVLTGIPIAIILWIFAEDLMSVFGWEFVEGADAMRVYVLGMVFLLVCGSCNVLLSMCNQEANASRIVWIGLAINFSLDLILIPQFGAIGCAYANMISMLFISVAGAIMSFRTLGINATISSMFFRNK